jgi:hypothetical protein
MNVRSITAVGPAGSGSEVGDFPKEFLNPFDTDLLGFDDELPVAQFPEIIDNVQTGGSPFNRFKLDGMVMAKSD